MFPPALLGISCRVGRTPQDGTLLSPPRAAWVGALLPLPSLNPYLRSAPFAGSALVRDYLSEVPTALEFFAGSPRKLGSYRAKLDDVTTRFTREDRERAAACLLAPSEAARERLERFVVEGGAMVTSGQQAGFLTGPLYTTYKALSAVVLARHLEARLGCIVLPVFWAATEDHDWAEVNHTYLLDPTGRLRRFELPPRATEATLPMSEQRLGEGVDKICDEALQYLGNAHHTSEYIERLVAPYRDPGSTVGGAFTAAMAELLGPSGVLIADAANPRLKRASVSTLRAALVDAQEHEAALAERSRSLLAAGYGTQVTILERGVNVFLHGTEGRQRLYRRGDSFIVRERPGSLERSELLALLEAEPDRFSPNVLLRPVIESTVFPTLAYVGGPGEINYFAQVTSLFETMKMAPPVVVPRFSGTVVEPAVERALQNLELTESDLDQPQSALVDKLARREIPQGVAGELRTIREAWVQGFGRLARESGAIDATLEDAFGAIRNRGLLEAARAERKILRALKRKESEWRQQLQRVLDSLRPTAHPQDRVLNVLSFLARKGPTFLSDVEQTIEETWPLPDGG